MNPTLEKRLQELVDKQDIVDVIHRYCRGIDRFDRELALSAYHSDAVEDHGIVVMKAADFVDWALSMHAELHVAHTHVVSNISIDLDGDTAHVESYYRAFCESKVKPNMVTAGRYVDRFERRDGKWAIAARFCISESLFKLDDFEFPEGVAAMLKSAGPAERSKSDVSYERPLKVKRPVQG
jgi:hypothetical protein